MSLANLLQPNDYTIYAGSFDTNQLDVNTLNIVNASMIQK